MSASGSYGGGGVVPPGPTIDTITGNVGGPVGPTANNINLIGAGGVLVTGNPGTSTLTITAPGAVATTYVEDVGNAAAIAGILNVVGGASTAGVNMNTFGDGANTIEVILNDSLLFPNTNNTGTMGVLFWNGNRFVHNYGSNNTFIGSNAGNLTLTTVSATDNTALGNSAGTLLTTGDLNTFVGSSSGEEVSSGASNTALGFSSLSSLTTGSNNIGLGFTAGFLYNAAESSNIVIGHDGVLGENNTIHLGTDGVAAGQQDACYVAGVYNRAFASPSGVVQIDSNFKLGSSAGTDGQLLIGATGASPLWANLTSVGGSVVITNFPNSINLEATGTGAGASAFPTDSGTANEVGGMLNVFGGNSAAGKNIRTTGAGNTVSVILHDSLLFPNTNSAGTAGVLFWGGNRFLHNYGSNNTFLGENSGNLTLTTASATDNTGLGNSTGTLLTTGDLNTFVGSSSGEEVSSGSSNTSLGFAALNSLTTGNNNIALGAISGSNYTGAESSNIVINNFGTTAENNTIRIGTDGVGSGQQDACYIAGIYNRDIGPTNAAVYIDDTGKLGTMDGGITLGGSSFMSVVSPREIIGNNSVIGTFFLGAQLPMVVLYDNFGGAFFPGDGAGTGATFTAPVDGFYSFTNNIVMSNASSSSNLAPQLNVNGTLMFQNTMPRFSGSGSTGQQSYFVSAFIQLNAGDTVTFSSIVNQSSIGSFIAFEGDVISGQPYKTTVFGQLLKTA